MVYQVDIMNANQQARFGNAGRLMSRRAGWFWFLLLLLLPMPAPGVASIVYLVTVIWCILQVRNGTLDAIRGLKRIWPFLAIYLIGLLQIYRHILGDVLKDSWYFSLPILTFITGWLLAPLMHGLRRYRILLVASLISGAWYQIQLVPVVLKISINDRYAYRQEAGTVDFIVVWGVLVALGWISQWRRLKLSDKKLMILTLIINFIAIALSYSRTAYVVVAISLLMTLPSFIYVNKRLIYAGAIGLLIVFIPILSALKSVPAGDNTSSGGMVGSIQEISGQEFATLSDINTRWRAYEAAQALGTYLEGNPVQYLIGQGLGTLVDLKIEMDLGTAQQIQFIPILHNGYMYLLVKTGILGVILFLWQVVNLWPRTPTQDRTIIQPSGIRIIRVILLSTIFSTLVITGPYNKGTWFSAMLILGMILRDQFMANGGVHQDFRMLLFRKLETKH